MTTQQAAKPKEAMETIRCKTTPYTINGWTIVRLPDNASAKLPSRGQVMGAGTINDAAFETPLEPDGRGSHWFHIKPNLLKAAHIAVGEPVMLSFHAIKDWPEPEIPTDLQKALAADPKAHELFEKITPLARWEWIRWSRATNNAETRAKRLEVACSKLRSGERRPCCWNRNLSTEPSVSKSGVLLEPNA